MRTRENLTGRSLRLLRMLYEKGSPVTNYTIELKQSELAKELGITRQALNVHLRRLRNLEYIRTGRGFIDVTEKGLNTLGVSVNPAFVLLKIAPKYRTQAYKEIETLATQRAFRVAGDFDIVLIVEREKLDEVLKKIAEINGVKETKSYVTIQTLR